jgi:hypothetical protein
MKYYLKGLGISLLILLPTLYYIHSFDSQKQYVDVSFYATIMFFILSIVLFLFLKLSLHSTNKQLFISVTLTNMLVKMIFSIALLVMYKEINQPQNGKFILPFLTIYLIFTIFETWFMVKMADQNL